jgi:NAD(P)H-nitrite reductase large subunit
VQLQDRETIECRRVVVATGISAFASRPAIFDRLPPHLASHSSEHADLARFAGERVAVIGGGQSAIESAALLREEGAEVELIMRARRLNWVGRAPRDGIIGRLLFDRTDVGPAVLSHIVAQPMRLRRMPTWVLREVTRSALEPGGSLWLRRRLKGLPVTSGRHVVDAARSNGHVALRLDDGSAREVHHVLLATGYRVDIERYQFLAPLLAHVSRVDGQPVLDEGFQSSVPGLHFLGAPATHSFGPLLRFVSGTEFAARMLVQAATKKRPEAVHAIGDRGVEIQQTAHQVQ